MPGFAKLTLGYKQHPSSLLKGLNSLRQHNLLCDCTLIIEEHQFLIHRAVLAASSDYFRALFTADLRENGSPEVTLKGISAGNFQPVVDFMYTGEVTLTQSNLADIYTAADMLRIDELQSLCHDYLLNQLCSSNCIGIWRYARLLQNHVLEEFAWSYLTSHFKEVKEGQEFLELDTTNRFTMPTQHFHKMEEREVWKLILAAKESERTVEDKHYANNRDHLDSPMKSLVAVGGYNGGLERTCEAYNNLDNCWQPTDWGLPTHCKHIHWVGVVGVRLYAIAGNSLTKVDLVMSRLTDEAAKRLQTDALSMDWDEEATLPHDCSSMKFCVLHKHIYACGELPDSTYGIRRYDTSNGLWKFVTDASQSKVFFQLFSHGSKLYILGGLCTLSELPVSLFESYDPYTDSWEVLNEMAIARYDFGVGILEDRLYAIGGMGSDNTVLDSVELYSFETKTWSDLRSLPSPRAAMACREWDGKLFCVGGHTEGTGSIQVSDVFTFDPYKEEWTSTGSLSHPRIYSDLISFV